MTERWNEKKDELHRNPFALGQTEMCCNTGFMAWFSYGLAIRACGDLLDPEGSEPLQFGYVSGKCIQAGFLREKYAT